MMLLALRGVIDTLNTFVPSPFCGIEVSNGILVDVLADAAVFAVTVCTYMSVRRVLPYFRMPNDPTLEEIEVILFRTVMPIVVIEALAAFNVTVETAEVDRERLVIVVTEMLSADSAPSARL